MSIENGLIICGILGFLISLYFTLVYYGLMKPSQWFIPPICRMDEGTCQTIIHTSDAKILGAPNFVLGLSYYITVIAYASVPFLQQTIILHRFLLAISFATIILGVYLSYSLLFKLRTTCVLCFSSHVLNLIIVMLLFFR
jgi:uncharacterized membrane protein